MCIHEFYFSIACGHHFPKLPLSARPSSSPKAYFNDYHQTIAVPQSLTCAPVKLALKFYHDQVVYLPADMNCGSKVEIPKMCPIVHMPRDGFVTSRARRESARATIMLQKAMLDNGLCWVQERQVEDDALNLEQCSNRAKQGVHRPAELRRHKQQQYPLNMYAHVQSVKTFQTRDKRFMTPNVQYTNVDFGCGGPFFAECLTGWDRVGLLTHRLHLWSDLTTHPKPCNHECLTGWSGADLDAYRQQIWAGDNLRKWKDDVGDNYPKLATAYVFKHTDDWAILDYSNVSHLHADQFHWNGHQFLREMKPEVYVPELVSVPLPKRLDQVLRAMSHVSAAGESEELAREEVLTEEGSERRVPVVEGSESDATAVDEQEEGSEQRAEETPEAAEERGQRARQELREKLKRDFSTPL